MRLQHIKGKQLLLFRGTHMMKKSLTLVLSFFVFFFISILFNVPVYGEEPSIVAAGNYYSNSNITWQLTGSMNDLTLRVSGTGVMEEHDWRTAHPWNDYNTQIKHVVVENGISGLGSYAFYKLQQEIMSK